jgi:hypothetical protein
LVSIENDDQWPWYAGLPPHSNITWTTIESPLVVNPTTSTSVISSIIPSHIERPISAHVASGDEHHSIPACLCNLPLTRIEHAVLPSSSVGVSTSIAIQSCGSNDSSTNASALTDSLRASPPSRSVSSGLSTSNSSRNTPRSPSTLRHNSALSLVYTQFDPHQTNHLQPSSAQRHLPVPCRVGDCPKISLGKRADE